MPEVKRGQDMQYVTEEVTRDAMNHISQNGSSHNEGDNLQHIHVTQPRGMMILGIAGLIFFLACWYFAAGGEDTPLLIDFIFGILVGLCIVCIVGCLPGVWELEVDDDDIYSIRFKKKKAIGKISTLTSAKMKNGNLTAYEGDRKVFRTEDSCIGYELLVKRLEKEHVKGASLREAKKQAKRYQD